MSRRHRSRVGPQGKGFSVGGNFQNQSAGDRTADIAAMVNLGANWVRIDINWAQIQSVNSSTFSWTAIDAVVDEAVAAGLKITGMIGYTPAWARPGGTTDKYPPTAANYATFCTAAVAHYAARGVHTFEVWNEPNIAFWTSPNVANYTTLLKAAYPAIKAADPTANVLIGGLSPAPDAGGTIAPLTFLQGIYTNGGQNYFNAANMHPYTQPGLPGETQAWNPWYQMTQMRAEMVSRGDSAKRIWMTEFGAATKGLAGQFVSEARQAEMFTAAWSTIAGYTWAGPLFGYNLRDYGGDVTNYGNWFGVLKPDWSPKPSAAAFTAGP